VVLLDPLALHFSLRKLAKSRRTRKSKQKCRSLFPFRAPHCSSLLLSFTPLFLFHTNFARNRSAAAELLKKNWAHLRAEQLPMRTQKTKKFKRNNINNTTEITKNTKIQPKQTRNLS